MDVLMVLTHFDYLGYKLVKPESWKVYPIDDFVVERASSSEQESQAAKGSVAQSLPETGYNEQRGWRKGNITGVSRRLVVKAGGIYR